ncbi:MAG: hypothetical protein IPK08_15700 [Bacteroidetes bacterium]|nr:hypothetical protein [Bacteroidota bacterium]
MSKNKYIELRITFERAAIFILFIFCIALGILHIDQITRIEYLEIDNSRLLNETSDLSDSNGNLVYQVSDLEDQIEELARKIDELER